MHEHSTIGDLIEAITNNPKITAFIATTTSAIGAAAGAELIHGALVNLSMAAGIVVTILLGRVHWIKYKIMKRQLQELESGNYKENDYGND